MVMTLSQAQGLIGPQERTNYCEWVREGVRDYFRSYAPDLRLRHSSRSRASLIHDHIIDRVQRGFERVRGARLLKRRGRYLLAVRDAFLGSFKMLDRWKRTRSIPTRQATRFVGQLPLGLDVPDTTHLILGYQLNELQTDYEAVYIICPSATGILWEWRIDEPASPLELPVVPAKPVAPVAPRTRVRLKGASIKDPAEADEASS